MKRTPAIIKQACTRGMKAIRGAATSFCAPSLRGAAFLICAVAALSLLFFTTPAHAQASSQDQKPIVTVADFAGTGISSAELAALRASFEIELLNTGAYNLVERTQADAILREQQYQLSGCVDEACMIEVGKHLGAQYVFVGTASKIGSTIQIIIKMVDVKLGSLLKAATVSGRTVDELASALPRAALELSGRSDLTGGSGQLAWDSTAGSGGTASAGGAAGSTGSGGASGSGTAPAERAYVTFESAPPGMTLVIKDASGKILGTYQTPKALPLGRGAYIVEAEDPAGMYYPYKENLDFSRPAKATFRITMAPRFGTVSISSEPSGARVSLNGLDIGVTPITGRQLKSGTYEIALSMDLYTTKRVTLSVQDGRTAIVSERLTPNFVTLEVREKNGLAAELWIDGKKAADLPYSGKLPFRDFDISVRSKDGRYRPYDERVIVRSAGETLSRAVALEPRTGTLAVETEPTAAADVYLDGKKIGTAPDIFTVLMGDHEVRVTAVLNGQRMEAVKKVTITEGRETTTVLALSAAAEASTASVAAASQSDYTSPTIGTLKYVPGGTFQRDSTASNTSTVSPFRMSQYEITRAQFKAVMGTDPSFTQYSSGSNDPVQNVNWYHAIAFCNKLSIAEGLTPVYSVQGVDFRNLSFSSIPTETNAAWDAATADWKSNGYRLPTAMEWIWAAMGADTANPGQVNRTGHQKPFVGSTGSNSIDDYAWLAGNSGGKTHQVGTKRANEIDLYDMNGNVWEWCWDWYGAQPSGANNGYVGAASGTSRAAKGGCWYGYGSSCTITGGGTNRPYSRDKGFGFRVVLPCTNIVTSTANSTPTNSMSAVTTSVGSTPAGQPVSGVASTVSGAASSQNDYTSPTIGVLKYVPGGTFQRDDNASNTSTVSAFRMSQYEITRAQFKAVMGTDPSLTRYSSGTNDPVQNVNWYHAIAFCNKLSIAEGLTPVYSVQGVDFRNLGFNSIPTSSNSTWDALTADWKANGYRLPTEMEWMWAAMGADTANPGQINRTGYKKPFAGSTASNSIGDHAWFTDNSGGKTHPAGTKKANELGLYDMSGNVWEWCWDWNGDWPSGAKTGYIGAASGRSRVNRGGSWDNGTSICPVSHRSYGRPYDRGKSYGFRIVRP